MEDAVVIWGSNWAGGRLVGGKLWNASGEPVVQLWGVRVLVFPARWGVFLRMLQAPRALWEVRWYQPGWIDWPLKRGNRHFFDMHLQFTSAIAISLSTNMGVFFENGDVIWNQDNKLVGVFFELGCFCRMHMFYWGVSTECKDEMHSIKIMRRRHCRCNLHKIGDAPRDRTNNRCI